MTDDDSNVIPLNNVTRLNMPPDRILEDAKGTFDDEGIIVIGWKKDGELYFASSIADGATILWLLEHSKLRLLSPREEDDSG